MPTSKEEWNSGKKSDTFEKQILSFLRKNQNIAYSLPEIVSALGYKIGIGDLGSFVGGIAGFGFFKTHWEDLVKKEMLKRGKSPKTLENKDFTRPHSDNKGLFFRTFCYLLA